jgi:predicted ATPase
MSCRLLQLRVAGGQDYRTAGRLQQQQSGPSQPESTAAAGDWLLGPDSNQQLQQQWHSLAAQMHAAERTAVAAAAQAVKEGPTIIPLPFGRSLWVPKAIVPAASEATMELQQGTQEQHSQEHQPHQQRQEQQRLFGAYFTFKQLCGNSGSRQSMSVAGALSANDYLALVQSCAHLFVEGLPQLQPNQRDEVGAWQHVSFVC